MTARVPRLTIDRRPRTRVRSGVRCLRVAADAQAHLSPMTDHPVPLPSLDARCAHAPTARSLGACLTPAPLYNPHS